MPVIQVGDADVARRRIIDHADAFSNHHAVPLAVDFDAGHPKTQSITSAPHGPLWRALRRNLTAGILHPSRLAGLALPVHRDATAALVAGLSSSLPAGGGGAVVAVRDALYAAAFAAVARLCLGDDRWQGRISDERLEDLPYLRAVILESLRLHPPLPLVVREVGPEGVALAGATPPPDGKFERFTFMADEIGRDEKAWAEPEEFRPERFLAGGEGEDVSPVPGPKGMKMMPFGAGRRQCPGAGMAMVHVGCFVAALVREFEWAPPADGGGVDLTAINALFVKVIASPLKARIKPRASLSS